MSNGFLKLIKSIYSKNNSVETDSNYAIAILIVVVLSIIIITMLLKNEARIIDKEWDKYRCHPNYVFIGGLIHKEEGTDPMTYTAMNIGHCLSKTAGKSILGANKKMDVMNQYEKAKSSAFDTGLNKMSSAFSDVATYTAIMTLTLNNMANNINSSYMYNTKVIQALFKNLRLYLAQTMVGMDYVKEYSKSMLSMFAYYHKEKEDKYHNSLGKNPVGRWFQRNIWKGEKYEHHKKQKKHLNKLNANI